MKEEKEERQGKNKIRVGSIVTAKVGGIEYKARVWRSIWMRKETLGCVQYVLWNKINR